MKQGKDFVGSTSVLRVNLNIINKNDPPRITGSGFNFPDLAYEHKNISDVGHTIQSILSGVKLDDTDNDVSTIGMVLILQAQFRP